MPLRTPEVHLRLARRVRERNQHLLRGGLPLLHGVLRRRVTAGVAPFDLQPVEDPLRRVPLLLWLLLVLLQHLVDPCRVRAQHRVLTTRSSPISRWLHVHEHLHQRSPVDAVLPAHSVLLAQRLLQFPSGDARLDSRRPPLATSDRGHGTFQPPISSPIPQKAGRQFLSKKCRSKPTTSYVFSPLG